MTAELIRKTDFHTVGVCPLLIAGYIESFALLIGQLAYEGKESPELAYRFERLGR